MGFIRRNIKKISKKRAIIALIIFSILTPFYMYFSDDPERLISEYPLVEYKDERVSIEWFDKKPKGWTTLNQISKYGKWAIILSEDWSFYNHEGIDFSELKKAVDESLKEKKLVRGASTISQQLVKNVFLSHSRSLWRKAHEMILTYRMEKIVPKAKILEVYFNVIEFGPGIYGIRQASWHYFKKSPSELNPREASFLAMLLPGPKTYYISFRKKSLTAFARSRVKNNLRKLKWGKIINEDERLYWQSAKMSWER